MRGAQRAYINQARQKLVIGRLAQQKIAATDLAGPYSVGDFQFDPMLFSLEAKSLSMNRRLLAIKNGINSM